MKGKMNKDKKVEEYVTVILQFIFFFFIAGSLYPMYHLIGMTQGIVNFTLTGYWVISIAFSITSLISIMKFVFKKK